jgi:hypothetical protein
MRYEDLYFTTRAALDRLHPYYRLVSPTTSEQAERGALGGYKRGWGAIEEITYLDGSVPPLHWGDAGQPSAQVAE